MTIFGAKERVEPGFPRAVNLDELDRRLGETALVPVAAPSALSDPLHPMVAELINQSQIKPAEVAREAALKNGAAMLAELQHHLAEDRKWWDDLIEKMKQKAALSAALHVKLRAYYETMASARAAYDSPELPAVAVPEPPEPKDAA